MFKTAETIVERIVVRHGQRETANPRSAATAATGFQTRRLAEEGEPLFDFVLPAAKEAADCANGIKAVIAATFSNEQRFPALSVRLASTLGLPHSTAAFDVQMACSAYPYALYLATQLARDLGGRVLVIDADIQSRFIDGNDNVTALVMDDAATATIVSARTGVGACPSQYDFFSKHSDALDCPGPGPVKMDGFKVFAFVATDVARFLRPFGSDFDMFAPHRANMYMVRQLAKSLGLEDRLLAPEAGFANPGSASVAATLAICGRPGRALVAGFGAGLSAAAGVVTLADHFKGEVI